MRVNSHGVVVSKSKKEPFSAGLQYNRLQAFVRKKIDVVICENDICDICVIPVKILLGITDMRIRKKIDTADKTVLPDIIYSENDNRWYQIMFTLLFVRRNEIDHIYGKINMEKSGHYSLKSFLEIAKKGKVFSERNFDKPEDFLDAAEITSGNTFSKTATEIIRELRKREQPLYEVIGQDINAYTELFHLQIPDGEEIWGLYNELKPVFSDLNLKRFQFRRLYGYFVFTWNNVEYVIHVRKQNDSYMFLFEDGFIADRKKLKSYLVNGKENGFERKFARWFDGMEIPHEILALLERKRPVRRIAIKFHIPTQKAENS